MYRIWKRFQEKRALFVDIPYPTVNINGIGGMGRYDFVYDF